VTLALVDGDLIAYRAALGPQQEWDWGDNGGIVKTTDPTAARLAAVKMVHEWADMVNATDIIVCLTGPDKFRTRILPSYNSNRKGEKPLAHADAVQAIREACKFHLINHLEADDLLGILMTTPKYADKAVIVSIDKDLATIPGRLFNPTKDTFPRTISEPAANHWWMTQTLTGDTVDGYSGLAGIGPAKAAKILGGAGAPLGTLWGAVAAAYRAKGLTEEDALVQARMARILRREDYDTPGKRIRLWHPTTPLYIPLEPTQEVTSVD
jgi:DNA polymerase-1